MELTCTKNKCAIEEETLYTLDEMYRNSLLTWLPGNNSQFWGITLQNVARDKLGVKKPVTSAVWAVRSMNQIQMISCLYRPI